MDSKEIVESLRSYKFSRGIMEVAAEKIEELERDKIDVKKLFEEFEACNQMRESFPHTLTFDLKKYSELKKKYGVYGEGEGSSFVGK